MVTNPETVLNQYHDAGRPPSFALQTNYAEIAVGFSSLRLSTPGWANFPLSGLRGIDTTELLFELSKEKSTHDEDWVKGDAFMEKMVAKLWKDEYGIFKY